MTYYTFKDAFYKFNSTLNNNIVKSILQYIKTCNLIKYEINFDNLNIIETTINIASLYDLDLENPIIYRDSFNNISILQCYDLNEIIYYLNINNINKICIPILSNSITDKFKNGCLYWGILIFIKINNQFISYWFNINSYKYIKTETELICNENLLFTLLGKNFKNEIIDIKKIKKIININDVSETFDLCITLSKYNF